MLNDKERERREKETKISRLSSLFFVFRNFEEYNKLVPDSLLDLVSRSVDK